MLANATRRSLGRGRTLVPSRWQATSITTLVTPSSNNRSAIVCNERVIVEYVVTSCARLLPVPGSRAQHTNVALPMSKAAIRSITS